MVKRPRTGASGAWCLFVIGERVFPLIKNEVRDSKKTIIICCVLLIVIIPH